jgi:hypothetical protein
MLLKVFGYNRETNDACMMKKSASFPRRYHHFPGGKSELVSGFKN